MERPRRGRRGVAPARVAERDQESGHPGWSVDQTVAAIEQVAHGSAGGTAPTADHGPAAPVVPIERRTVISAVPWTIQPSRTPASGSTFDASANDGGTITVTSATGNGVRGLEHSAPPTGGGQTMNTATRGGAVQQGPRE
jgi:hypothetical protein